MTEWNPLQGSDQAWMAAGAMAGWHSIGGKRKRRKRKRRRGIRDEKKGECQTRRYARKNTTDRRERGREGERLNKTTTEMR